MKIPNTVNNRTCKVRHLYNSEDLYNPTLIGENQGGETPPDHPHFGEDASDGMSEKKQTKFN